MQFFSSQYNSHPASRFLVAGGSTGGLYAGATAGNGVAAGAGLGGVSSGNAAVGGSFAGASSGASGGYVTKTKTVEKSGGAALGGSGAFGASFSGYAEQPVAAQPQKEYIERTVIPNYVEKTIQVPSYVEKTVRVPTVIEQRVRVPAPPTVIEKTVSAPPADVQVVEQTNVQSLVPSTKQKVSVKAR